MSDANSWPYWAGIVAAVTVLGLFAHRAQRSPAWQQPLRQLFGGLNMAAAALLVFLTIGFIAVMGLEETIPGGLGAPFMEVLTYGAGLFVLAMGFVWARWGLVPHTTAPDKVSRLAVGHLLILIGTVGYGGVTFYLPVLAWLGIVPWEATAVLPWLVLITFPMATIVWPTGLVLIFSSRAPVNTGARVAKRRFA
jgi:hypothetical protein